ncbi:MAG: hypothetical protein CMH53_02910 [Myxococcales bacterium]|nr:hypothetical protein [Myxococcales bacterium]
MLLVTGKGGVGKSIVSAAIARRAAAEGKEVLLLEFEEVSRAAPLFGLQDASHEAQSVAPRLSIMGFDLMRSLRTFALDQLRVKTLVDLALRNDSVRGFFLAMPAIKSILFLYRLYQIKRDEGPYDLVVCDLPTSGFVLGLYGVPTMLGQIFRLGPLAQTVQQMSDLLHGPGRSGLVLVTLAEEMPVVETIELAQELTERHRKQVAAVVVNGVYHQAMEPEQWEVLQPMGHSAELNDATFALLSAVRIIQDRARRAKALIEQLGQSLALVPCALPHLFERNLGLDDVDRLAEHLTVETSSSS